MISNLGWLAFPAGLIVSVLVSSLGFMLQTLGLKEGNTVIVCTCAAVSSMATGQSFEPLERSHELLDNYLHDEGRQKA